MKIPSGRSGFTLIEAIITLLIVGIAIAMSITFLTTGSNFLNRTEENAADKTVAEKGVDFIKGRLLYASEVEVVKNKPLPTEPDGREIIFIGNADGTAPANSGHIFYRSADADAPMDVLGDATYRDNELALSYSAIVTENAEARKDSGVTKSAIFDADVMVIRDGKRTQNARQTFRMFNIGQNSEPLSDSSVTSWNEGGSGMATFYLLITPLQEGYATSGLLARFDAIDNALTGSGEPVHNASQHDKWSDLSGNNKDMLFTLTGNQTPVRDSTIYFDGDGDFGKIANMDLSKYSAVTVEICFREATDNAGILFEYAKENSVNGWNSDIGTFGAALNSDGLKQKKGEMHSVAKVGENSEAKLGARNFSFPADTTRLKTVAFVASNLTSPNGRMAFVNGNRGPDGTGVNFISSNGYPTGNATTKGTPFGNWTFSVAARLTATPQSYCEIEIAAVRIYGRALNADELAKNADEDKARFGR